MANEISWSNLETDAGLAAYLYGELHRLLYDPTDLRSILDRKPFSPHMGSDSAKVTTIAGGQVFAAASTELSGGASNQSIGSGSFTFAVARHIMKWQVSDLWREVAPNGSINLDVLAALINEGAGLKVTDMVCALFGSLSNSVGSTVAQMKVDYVFDAQYRLNTARAQGDFNLILAPHCHNKFVDSLRGEGGVIQYQAYTADQIRAKSPIHKGNFNGIEVLCSDSVNLDGGSTYRKNALLSKGCFGYMEAPAVDVADALPPNVKAVVNGTIRIVHAYDADNAITSVIGDYYPAVTEQEDARGVVINALAA